MQTPFDDPIMKTPSADGDFRGTRGGVEMDGGQKETANTGGIPPLPTIDSFTGDTPPNWQDPSTFESNRTWPASKPQGSGE